MPELKKTVLYDEHVKLGGKMIDFGGWDMPVNYPLGIVKEHIATRESAGLFDVSHMGRFKISGNDSLVYLQNVLTNDASLLKTGKAQYTIIQNQNGGAVDDTYLYKFNDKEYILVVNASNRDKDIKHLKSLIGKLDVSLTDVSDEEGMIALQGPDSIKILAKGCDDSKAIDLLSNMKRNDIESIVFDKVKITISRTGYTGEKIGFELFVQKDEAPHIWNKLIECGATPVGLGARDTLRLEANMPLYGHELGIIKDIDGKDYDIPIFAGSLAKFAVSFNETKGDSYGRQALKKTSENPAKRIFPIELKGKGVPRAGYEVTNDGNVIGVVTSGTILPDKRAIGLALLDNSVGIGDEIEVMIRDKAVPAVITKTNLK